MVGFWRTLYVLLSYRRRGPIALFETSRLHLRVMPGEIDFNLHIINSIFKIINCSFNLIFND